MQIQSVRVSYELDNSEEHRLGILKTVPPSRLFLMFSSWLEGTVGFGEEDHRGKVTISILAYRGSLPSTWFIPVDVDLDHLAEVAFAKFFHCKVTLFQTPNCDLWKGVTLWHLA